MYRTKAFVEALSSPRPVIIPCYRVCMILSLSTEFDKNVNLVRAMAQKLSKNINLLEPSFSPKTTWDKIYDWVFLAGRYIIVFVELIVLIALGSRFYFDRKNNDLSESIKAKTQILDSFEETEDRVRSAQETLANVSIMMATQEKMSDVLENVEANIPSSIEIQGLALNEKSLNITGLSYGYPYIEKLENNFSSDENWDAVEVTLVSSGAGRQISFTMTAQYVGGQASVAE